MRPSLQPSSAFASSPIGTLPVELLSEIFSISTLSNWDNHPCPGRSDYSPPTITSESVLVPHVLASVNRRWRSIALSQPSLWSNICVTPELLDWESNNGSADMPLPSQLNITHITTHLSRSKNYALNILIDGRDPDWDFSEPDVGIDFGTTTLNTLFSSEHMQVALSLLLPHIVRWKHLTILTDTWAPMYTALSIINPSLTQSGAPLLQSMSLMRCNDYVSYSRRFQPRQLKDLGFLTSPTSGKARANLLPSLKHLTLRGVHVDWDALGNILEASGNGLSHLELASHPRDVRPSISQFHKLLQSTPDLQTLYVVGTGPEGPGSENDSVHNYEPVHLPDLQSVALGYRSETGGRSLLHFLDAPNVQSLVLDDTTYPADQSDVNAGPILTYLGTKQCDGNEHSLEGTGQPSTEFEKRRKRSICAAHDIEDKQRHGIGAFPLLTHVVLRNVKSTFQPLTTFFNSLHNVTQLELSGMSMLSIHALLPYSLPPSNDIPCPRLHSLTFKDSDYSIEDLDFIITRLSSCRQARGAPQLHDLNFHVKPSRAGDVQLITAAAASSPDSKVRIFSDKDMGVESDDDDLIIEDEDEDGAFRPGGAFNDPIFDAYYGHTLSSH